MQILEIIIVAVIGIAAVTTTVFLASKNIKGRGTCSSEACASCSLARECDEKQKTKVGKNPDNRK